MLRIKSVRVGLVALGFMASSFLAVACGAGAGSTSISSADYRGGPAPVLQPKAGVTAQAGAPVVASIPPGPGVPLTEGPKVIRTGEMTLEVKKGAFDSSYQSAVDTVSALGGYIQSAQAQAQAEQGPLQTGTVTFAVPSDRFQRALESLKKIGIQKSIHIGGQDVSLQYVDLQARLGNLEAQREAMLALLQKATTVQDIITVQGQLGSITGQIEQLKGQIAYFDKATSYSTLTVTIREGAPVPAPAPAPDTWGLKAAFVEGLHAFVGTINAGIVGFGYVAPFLILASFGLLAWRLRRRFAL